MSVITIAMADRTGTTTTPLRLGTDWTYSGHVITLQGNKTVTGTITLTFNSFFARAVKELTVPVVNTEAVTPATSNVDGYSATKWAVVDQKNNTTVFNALPTVVNSWVGNAMFAESTLGTNWTSLLKGSDPRSTLTVNDNGSYLVCVYEDSSNNIIAAGCTLISGVTGAPSDAPVQMNAANTHLVPTIAGNVVTLTAEDDYLVPSATPTVTVNGKTAAVGKYTVSSDRKTATINLNAAINGPVVITAAGVAAIAVHDVAVVAATGKVTFDGSDGAASDKILILDGTPAEIISEITSKLAADAAVADVLTTLQVSDETTLTNAGKLLAGDAVVPAGGANSCILYMKIVSSKVTQIGAVANSSTAVTANITGYTGPIAKDGTVDLTVSVAGGEIASVAWSNGGATYNTVATVAAKNVDTSDGIGTVTYAGAGTATITATVTLVGGGTATATCDVTCMGITLSPTTLALDSGTATANVTATLVGIPADQAASIQWESSDETKAACKNTGLVGTVTYAAAGTTNVSASITYGGKTYTTGDCVVTCS